MFKFAKHFFIVFLIIMVIPLTLMFILSNHQVKNIEKQRDKQFLSMAARQTENKLEQYLEIQKNDILLKIKNASIEKFSINDLNKTIKPAKAEFIPDSAVKKEAVYYEIIKSDKLKKPELVIVIKTFFNKKGLKITKKVDLRQISPQGPFLLELYEGTNINKKSFIDFVRNPFWQKPEGKHPPMPPEMGMGTEGGRPPMPPEMGMEPEDGRPPMPPEMGMGPDGGRPPMPPEMGMGSEGGRPPMPPEMGMGSEGGRPPMPPKVQNIKEEIKIIGNDKKTVATLVIKIEVISKNFKIQKLPENLLGLFILIAGSALSLIVGFYINKNFIKPLLTLSEASKKVQKGNLNFQLNSSSKQEQIQETFNNFNQMIIGLKEKEELKSSFVENLTHDLKTPLISQERALEMLANEFRDANMTEQFKLAKGLERNNRHLLKMVNLILESYKIDSEKINIIISDINLAELVEDCFEKLQPLALEKNIQLINNINKEKSNVKADLTSLKRILLNIISNSIENINENCKVEVNAQIDENAAEITIEDNGSGIAQEDKEHLFDKYYTGKSTERQLGFGLGLYICKKLVDLNKGQIKVESEVGKYTKFIINLPV